MDLLEPLHWESSSGNFVDPLYLKSEVSSLAYEGKNPRYVLFFESTMFPRAIFKVQLFLRLTIGNIIVTVHKLFWDN